MWPFVVNSKQGDDIPLNPHERADLMSQTNLLVAASSLSRQLAKTFLGLL